MELRQLRVFVAVAEELHFGRAADRLYLSQPSISGHIRQLERELQVALLRRTSRQVTLTDAGRALLDDARRILDQADAAAENVRSWGEGGGVRMRIGYVEDVVPRALPIALGRLSRATSPPQIELIRARPGELAERVRGGALDTAIVPVPLALHGLRAMTVAREEAAVAVAAGALHGDEDELPLELAAGEALLCGPRDDNPGLHDAALGAFALAGLASPLREVDSASVEHLLLRVVAGDGRALVPVGAAQRAAVPGIALRRLRAAAPIGCDLAMILAGHALSPPLAALRLALTGARPIRSPVTTAISGDGRRMLGR